MPVELCEVQRADALEIHVSGKSDLDACEPFATASVRYFRGSDIDETRQSLAEAR